MQFVALLSLLLQAHYYYYSTGTGASDLLISKQLNCVIIVLEQKTLSVATNAPVSHATCH